jgi:hypothetical protein
MGRGPLSSLAWASAGLAGCDEASLVSEGDERGAVVAVELAQDVVDVGLCGQRADDEAAGDLGVAESACDVGQYLAFALGEVGEGDGRVTGRTTGGEPRNEPAGDARCDERVAGGDDLDRVQQLAWAASLRRNPLAPDRRAS